MSSAARRSGSALVAGVVTATVGAIGYGCIYLPFVADRDEVRGFHEEDDRVLKQQYEQYVQEMKKQKELEAQSQQQPKAGSMWKAMRGGGGDGK